MSSGAGSESAWVRANHVHAIGIYWEDEWRAYVGNSDVPARLGLETPALAFGAWAFRNLRPSCEPKLGEGRGLGPVTAFVSDWPKDELSYNMTLHPSSADRRSNARDEDWCRGKYRRGEQVREGGPGSWVAW
ncbi:hypothetical protein M405DRAFT_931691 [Rhizopogon salebrosus TDB-379]|nr:hypothetical protein M405DRAFT_931691 [Rhizopogon salebrosus TDB-379]